MPPRRGAQAGRKRGGVGLGWLDRWFASGDDGVAQALYDLAVATARAPHWYVEGQVPDTLDGRFDMVSAVVAMILLRLEADPAAGLLTARLTERFVEDMDAQVRQIGFGDMVVGKQIGHMMAMLGGRTGAYREGIAAGDLDSALVRNLYRGAAPGHAAVAHVREALLAWRGRLNRTTLDDLSAGRIA